LLLKEVSLPYNDARTRLDFEGTPTGAGKRSCGRY
jgi:hypothetical protein